MVTWFVFLALTIATPIILSSHNSELFEVPKMLFVYLLATILFTTVVIKFISEKRIISPKNPIVYSLMALLAVTALSTFFSIDNFTSIFGYPSRLNGGLLSLIAYFVVFTTAIIALTKLQAKKLLAAMVITAFFVSLYGIPGHFGFDPTCEFLFQRPTSACWQKEFNPAQRIFSTLGQPNWFASFLILTLPLSVAFLSFSRKIEHKVLFTIFTLTILLALIFTNSRSGFVGASIAILALILLLGKKFITQNKRVLLPLLAVAIVTLVLFGSSFITRFKELAAGKAAGGTETSTLRLIVWQGAIDIFTKNPLLGTGPETFAYSYQKYRPLEHNKTTEWNFFYNKAHNEFLNYLANIGILGFILYLTFLFFVVKNLLQIAKYAESETATLAKAILAALIGYHVAIFFGFSTVSTQLYMFLALACVLILGGIQLKTIPLKIKTNIRYALLIITLLSGIWLATLVTRLYMADVLQSEGSWDSANFITPGKNPFYLSGSAYSKALIEQIEPAEKEAAAAFKLAPNNFIVVRKVTNTYILLSQFEKAQQTGLKLQELAPRDPQTYLTMAQIESAAQNYPKALEYTQKALELKHDYVDAQELNKQLLLK